MNDYERIAEVIRHLDGHHFEQPDLAALAGRIGLSSFHFHRLFSSWAGITPKDFLQCLTLEHAKRRLRAGQCVLDAALDSGLSGPGRLHDLCVSLQAASPGEIKSGGAAWTTQAGFADSPFGACLVAESPRGICHLSFVETTDQQAGAAAIHKDWPGTRIRWDASVAERRCAGLFDDSGDVESGRPLRAFVRGGSFQVRVWRALLEVPPGMLVSYGRLAEAVGNRAAARAVGTAAAQNPLAYLIPCHRVIRETGVLGDYRWGRARKKAIVAWESARSSKSPAGRA